MERARKSNDFSTTIKVNVRKLFFGLDMQDVLKPTFTDPVQERIIPPKRALRDLQSTKGRCLPRNLWVIPTEFGFDACAHVVFIVPSVILVSQSSKQKITLFGIQVKVSSLWFP